jgi:hypothetical protein
MKMRSWLLTLSDSYFAPLLSGRPPSLNEKMLMVEQMLARQNGLQAYANDTYIVLVGHVPPFLRLTVKRHDGDTVRCWKDLQTIKNTFAHPECEAVELFPAESRLIDTANEYHLWVHSQAGFQFPLGFQAGRTVIPTPAAGENVL